METPLPDHTTRSTFAVQDSIVVTDKLAITAQTDILERIGDNPSLLTIGYAGWGPGQLEAELAAGFWSIAPAAESILFGTDHSRKWERARARIPLDL